MTPQQLFLQELELVRRVVAWVSSRHGLRVEDARDFESTVHTRLIENDYAVLARFEGKSTLKTYLTAVIHRIYLDFQVQRFGKWRPSAQARRLGPLALRLERLLYRDGLTFDEACGVLQSGPAPTESRDTLYALSLELPLRTQRQYASSDGHEPIDPASASSPGEQAERQALARRICVVLRRVIAALPARDRILMRLHFERGLSIADVARSLAEEQKALYRRRDGLLKQMRAELEAEGVRQEDVAELLSRLDWDMALTAEGLANEVGHDLS